jgi:hypothetical protein
VLPDEHETFRLDCLRAALSVMIEVADKNLVTAKQMQDFAIEHRGTDPD